MRRRRAAIPLAWLAMLGGLAAPVAAQSPSEATSQAEAKLVATQLADMSPAEKVGQLVLVAFYGTTPDPLRDVNDLIREQHIGGVVLQRTNNVFSNRDNPDLPNDIAGITAALQRTALDAGGVPLFIAVDHEGDSMSHLREGFTPLPNQMAIGATWDRAAAKTAGDIAGRELAAVGVNMLLGPVLDVLALPRSDSQGDLGTRVFGGDPYWVGEMGQAYIEGVYDGSGGKVLTIAKHFPGHGNSDRLPDQEVAVVSQGIEDLKKIELPPFAAVTVASVLPGRGVADGLMTSHIQYRGLQGNLRSVTRPLSFDRDGLQLLLNLPDEPFGPWRQRGGLLVSDSLGVKAVRRYFDPSDQTFPHREVARSALVAGNDVLTLAEFSQRQAWSVMRRNVSDTLAYLAASYVTDPELHARVDDAVGRILLTKRRLYERWSPDVVVRQPDATGLANEVRTSQDRSAIKAAMTSAVTALRAYDRPRSGNRLVVVTEDSRPLTCPAGERCGLDAGELHRLQALGPTLVEGYLLSRYGQGGTGLIRAEDVTSLTFCQLRMLLSPVEEPAEPSPTPPDIVPAATTPATCKPLTNPPATRTALEGADWVIFAYGDLRHDDAQLLNGFLLPEVASLVGTNGSAHLAVLAFGPPYFVDRTNIERLDAFVVGYTKIPAAIESTVAGLFGDPKPTGASPVSVEDAGYDLARALSPAVDQTLVAHVAPDVAALTTLPATLHLMSEVIVDGNGNPVPDDTPVELTVDPPEAISSVVQLDSQGHQLAVTSRPPSAPDSRAGIQLKTQDGHVAANLTLVSGGRVTIHLASPPAHDHEPIILDLPLSMTGPAGAPGSTAKPPIGGAPAPVATFALPPPGPGLDLFDLLAALSAACLSAAAGVWRAGRRHLLAGPQLRLALGAFGGAAAGYLGYAVWIALPASSASSWLDLGPLAALLAFAGAGGLVVFAERSKRGE